MGRYVVFLSDLPIKVGGTTVNRWCGSSMQAIHNAAGMMQMTDEWPADLPSHWMIYFVVSDCAASAETAESHGGQVLVPPTPAGDVGTFAVIQDPQGAAFSIIELDQPAE